MDRNAIIQLANSDPSFAKAVDAMEAQLGDMPIAPEDLDEAIKILEFVIENPDKYPQVREAAIKDGYVSEDMLPPQYDQVLIVSLLVALYGIQDRLKARGYARGGHVSALQGAAKELAAQGRGGDTMLAHINPREADMLERMGGSGTINPNTGLREYKSKFFKVLGTVLPVALSIIAPGVGTAIGTALGATGTGAAIVGGAVLGGASSALSGGNILQGAALGGLGGGLGSTVGGAANKALGLGLGTAAQNVLGSALIGGGVNAAMGKDFVSGMGQGALGGMIGNAASGNTVNGALGRIISAGGQQAGRALTVGYDPKQAAIMGGLSGLAAGIQYKPSQQVVDNLASPDRASLLNNSNIAPVDAELAGAPGLKIPGVTGNIDYTGSSVPAAAPATAAPGGTAGATTATPQTAAPATSGNNMMGKLLLGATALSALSKAPAPVQQAVSSLSPQQQEYFNRPSVAWDWDKLQRDAAASNMDLGRYMATNWPQITSGAYNTATQTTAQLTPTVPGMYRGGPLSNIAYMARGSGSGRADTIDAKLSDGEFVIDAETVALLGDGSSKRGAELLDEMRTNIRKQKGKALAKGKFSPNAKSPLSYIKGAA